MMATLGKAAGVAGAFVAGQQVVVEYLIQKAKSYVYSTPAPPAPDYTTTLSLSLFIGQNQNQSHDRCAVPFFTTIPLVNILVGTLCSYIKQPSSTRLQYRLAHCKCQWGRTLALFMVLAKLYAFQ